MFSFPLLFKSAARPLHVFAPALLAHLLLEAVVQDVQTLIRSLRTLCSSRVVFELECDDDIWKTHNFPLYYCQGNANGRTCSRVTRASFESQLISPGRCLDYNTLVQSLTQLSPLMRRILQPLLAHSCGSALRKFWRVVE